MKILYYKYNRTGSWVPGILTDDGVINVNEYRKASGRKSYSDYPLTIEDINELRSISRFPVSLPGGLINEKDLIIGPCVPRPSKIICIGLNYRKHAVESRMAIPDIPVVFTKYNNTLTEYKSNVILCKEGREFDYEVELGVIIGRYCKNVSRQNALDNVAGYCVANDLSCRDLQFKTSQWLLGKSIDRFLPLGKYFVTADEVDDPQNLKLSCILNSELRQHSNTADMIFSVAEIIEFLSKYMTLEPGDLILTGTPEGVIMGLPEKKWLQPGDIVKVEIEKLGFTENAMA